MGVKNERQVFAYRSVFDVLLDNLHKSRMVHLYRIVYVGETEEGRTDEMERFFSSTASEINEAGAGGEAQDALCALLIHYAKHFILMLEGSEEAILRHLAILMRSSPANSINRIFVLIMLRANQRLLEPSCEWRAMQLNVDNGGLGRRPSTGEPWQKARVCVDKLHRLASVLAASESNVSGPLSDRSMVPDAATLRQVIDSGLLQSAAQFAKRLAPVRHLTHPDDHVWPPEF